MGADFAVGIGVVLGLGVRIYVVVGVGVGIGVVVGVGMVVGVAIYLQSMYSCRYIRRHTLHRSKYRYNRFNSKLDLSLGVMFGLRLDLK